MTSIVERQVLRRREEILDVCARHQTVAGPAVSNTHDRILRAAIPMFATVGYEACTMRAIGEAVNVKGPALYNHFASKEQIFLEAIWLLFGEFFVEVLEPLVREPPDGWLESVIRRHTRLQIERSEEATSNDLLLQAEQLAPRVDAVQFQEIRSVLREYVRLVRDLAGTVSGTPSRSRATVDAYAIVSICDRTSLWYRPGGEMSAERVIDLTWDCIRRLLAHDAQEA